MRRYLRTADWLWGIPVFGLSSHDFEHDIFYIDANTCELYFRPVHNVLTAWGWGGGWGWECVQKMSKNKISLRFYHQSVVHALTMPVFRAI